MTEFGIVTVLKTDATSNRAGVQIPLPQLGEDSE